MSGTLSNTAGGQYINYAAIPHLTGVETDRQMGNKNYELDDHLGNVHVIVTDRKLGVDLDQNGVVDYYVVQIESTSDYYPFGGPLPNKGYSSGYRYGFNGQEKTDEINGSGNHTTALFWEYDTRLGRRWNIDPMRKAWESGYAVLGNSPISYSDPLGLEKVDQKTANSGQAKHGDTYTDSKGRTFTNHEGVGWLENEPGGEVGGETKINTEAKPSSGPKIQTGGLKHGTPWVDHAMKEYKNGVREFQTKKYPNDPTPNNPRIVEYLKSAGNNSGSDATPWCASFVHWSMKQSGIKGAGATGDDWASWGQQLSKPAYGAVAVFKTGHAAVIIGQREGMLVILHGNWSDKVTIDYNSPSEIKAYSYPSGYEPSYTLPKW